MTGATGVQADYLARMVRAGTFELRVTVDSLAVCWRAVQVVAGPTHAPRCKISMEGLQGLHTGDTCRLTLKAADQYGNLRLDGNDAIQLTLEGPGGAFARAVQVVDHADGGAVQLDPRFSHLTPRLLSKLETKTRETAFKLCGFNFNLRHYTTAPTRWSSSPQWRGAGCCPPESTASPWWGGAD